MRPPIAPSNFATFSFLLCLLLKRLLPMTEKKNLISIGEESTGCFGLRAADLETITDHNH